MKRDTARLRGEVVLWTPISSRLLTSLAVAIAASACTFLSIATYARHEGVSGWIVPAGGLIRVVARQGGRIEKVHVVEGQSVTKGATIASVNAGDDLKEGNAGAAIDESLTLQALATDAQLSASRQRLVATRQGLRTQLVTLSGALREVDESVQLANRKLELAERALERSKALVERGFLSNASLETAQTAQIAAQQEAVQARIQASSIRQQLDQVKVELAQSPADEAIAVAQSRQVRATLAQRALSNRSTTRYVVTAPESGTVGALPISEGQTIAPGTSIAVVTPRDSTLIAELFVPSQAAGFLAIGQEVQLRYVAFPYEKFGPGRGRVIAISSSALTPADLSIPGVQSKEPLYRVRVRLVPPFVKAYGRPAVLRPGMLLSAEIVIDRRTLIQWLLDPVFASGKIS